MKILNLYAGIGGNRKAWGDEYEVTAIEFDEETAKVYKDYFPNDNVIIADAHQYLLDHYKEFDFIWGSPPCPTHSILNTTKNGRGDVKMEYPDMTLYQEILFLDNWFKGKWVIENVVPYYTPLIAAKKVDMHLWWSNFNITSKDTINTIISNNSNATYTYRGSSTSDNASLYNLGFSSHTKLNAVQKVFQLHLVYLKVASDNHKDQLAIGYIEYRFKCVALRHL